MKYLLITIVITCFSNVVYADEPVEVVFEDTSWVYEEYPYFLGTTPENVNLTINPLHIKMHSKYSKLYKVWVIGNIDTKDLVTAQSKLYIKYNDIKMKKANNVKMLFYVDCESDKLAECKYIWYDKVGAVIKTNDPCEYYQDYDDVVPETLGESVLEYVCQYVNVNNIK